MTNKELIEKCRAIEKEATGRFAVHPTITLLCDRLEAADAEIDRLKGFELFARDVANDGPYSSESEMRDWALRARKLVLGL